MTCAPSFFRPQIFERAVRLCAISPTSATVRPAIEPRRGHALVPLLVDGEDILHEPVEIAAVARRHRHHRHVAKLRQRALETVAHQTPLLRRVVHEVPLVYRDDQAAALGFDDGSALSCTFDLRRAYELDTDD